MAVETDSAPIPSAETDADVSSAGAAAAHGSATEAEHSAGLPQFQFQHWGGQIAYLLILFVALYILMSRVFAPRVRRVLDERASTIADAISSAKALQAQADVQADEARRALADARASAQRTAVEARTRAAAAAQAQKAELEAELSAKQVEAESRIRVARDAAMTQLSVVATEAAEAMLEKLTGAKTPRAAVAAAVKSQG
jgi:F-type H+-transporting ATPase subunit b